VYKGFIFDFDGLIIDTEMPCYYAWVELFEQYGSAFTMQDYGKIIGTDNSVYNPAKHLSELSNGLLDPLVIRDQILKRTRELIDLQPLLPGVHGFLQSAQSLGIPMAMASSSNRSWVEGYLSSLKIKQYFQVVCTSDDVSKVKPDPELFLLAARKIGLAPDEIIVFEDSPNGVKAAKAVGMACIAIPNELTITMDLSLADKTVKSFQYLDPKILLKSINTI
jgi:HAD superfamily hydrolase (TIGR01509 family)